MCHLTKLKFSTVFYLRIILILPSIFTNDVDNENTILPLYLTSIKPNYNTSLNFYLKVMKTILNKY